MVCMKASEVALERRSCLFQYHDVSAEAVGNDKLSFSIPRCCFLFANLSAARGKVKRCTRVQANSSRFINFLSPLLNQSIQAKSRTVELSTTQAALRTGIPLKWQNAGGAGFPLDILAEHFGTSTSSSSNGNRGGPAAAWVAEVESRWV